MLAGPLGRGIAETSDADAARQSSLNGSLHEFRREERERDRHIDLSNAAFVARSNLLDTGDSAGNNLIEPMPATRDRCDERGAGLGANGSKVVWRHNIASEGSPHREIYCRDRARYLCDCAYHRKSSKLNRCSRNH